MVDHVTGFRPVERRRAFEQVVLQIEEAIASGSLKAGDRLPPERELAVIFDVSRNSVREALRILEAFGVIAARQGRGPDAGSVITAVERNGLSGMLRLYATVLRIPLRDLVEVRVALEAMNARAAATHADAGRLEELAREMGPEGDKDAFLRLDTEFHVALARASGNTLAPLLMEALREAIGREMRHGFDTLDDWPGTRDRLVAEHAEIAAHVAAGDGDAAARAVDAHVRNFYRLMEP
jgi:GntR family transcriptional regulator, transcriptional repressor for pyruvate dehydrogenase complex